MSPVRPSESAGLDAVASAIEDVAGRLSIADRPEDLEKAVNDLLTIAKNAQSGLLG